MLSFWPPNTSCIRSLEKLGNMRTAGSINLLDSIHNPTRIIGTRKVSFRIPEERLGTRQIVGLLHGQSENNLVHWSWYFMVIIYHLC